MMVESGTQNAATIAAIASVDAAVVALGIDMDAAIGAAGAATVASLAAIGTAMAGFLTTIISNQNTVITSVNTVNTNLDALKVSSTSTNTYLSALRINSDKLVTNSNTLVSTLSASYLLLQDLKNSNASLVANTNITNSRIQTIINILNAMERDDSAASVLTGQRYVLVNNNSARFLTLTPRTSQPDNFVYLTRQYNSELGAIAFYPVYNLAISYPATASGVTPAGSCQFAITGSSIQQGYIARAP